MYIIDDEEQGTEVPVKLKIMGIGGGGSNVISYIYQQNLPYATLIAANTDAKALSRTLAHQKLTIGEGLGAGGDPEKGRKAMEASVDKVKEIIKDANLLMLIATLGGGTGTGGIPVVARLAKEMGILTIGIVTLPFLFEGELKKRKAQMALSELEEVVDTLLVIEDQKLIEITNEDIPFDEAFHIADEMLYQAVRGITSIIFRVGTVNVDFADLQKTIEKGGRAIMGSATGAGKNAVMEAVEKAINNPLLENSTMINARNILVYFTGRPKSISLKRIQDAINYIKEVTNTEDKAHEVIFGVGEFPYGEEPDYDVEVTIIATSGKEEKPREKPSEGPTETYEPFVGETLPPTRPDKGRKPSIIDKIEKIKRKNK